MIEEKKKEMQNLTEVMQKKIEQINDDPPADDRSVSVNLDQIKSLEEKCRKYEGQILQAKNGREAKEKEFEDQISKIQADLNHQKELYDSELKRNQELQTKVDTILEQQSIQSLSEQFVDGVNAKVVEKIKSSQNVGEETEEVKQLRTEVAGLKLANEKLALQIDELKNQKPADGASLSQAEIDKQIEEALKKQQTKLEEQYKVNMNKLNDEIRKLGEEA